MVRVRALACSNAGPRALANALAQLAAGDAIYSGLLRLFADAGAALAALDAMSADLTVVLARARRCDPEAVEVLADLVEARLLRASPRPRGGDQRAAERAQRDAALRQLAARMGADMPRERLARDLAGRLKRFRPMPTETAPDRVLMREIIASGLPVPGPDRLARILRGDR